MKRFSCFLCVQVLFVTSLASLAKAQSATVSNRPRVGIVFSVTPKIEIGSVLFGELTITNWSSESVKVPNFHFLNLWQENAEAAFYVKQQVLKIDVKQDGKPVFINAEWQAPLEKAVQFPLFELLPGGYLPSILVLNSKRSAAFYSLTNPGIYTVTITLNTTKGDVDGLLKGVFVSAPVTVEIVPVPTFRPQQADESPKDYTQAKVEFYLKRIATRQGDRFKNMSDLLRTDNAIPAVINELDSHDKSVAGAAKDLLLEGYIPNFYSPISRYKPVSKTEWMEWWNAKGKNMAPQELWRYLESQDR